MFQPCPNSSVWNSANQYIESAEILLDYNRIHSAAMLSALAIEILLKSFLSKRVKPRGSTTKRGHSLTDLFKELCDDDKNDLKTYFEKESCDLELEEGFELFSNFFVELRYPHEPSAPFSCGSDIVYYARCLCDAVYKIGTTRGQ